MASLANLAGYVTVGVTSLAATASVVTIGVVFQEKCDVPSGLVCDYDDFFMMDIMMRTLTILTMMIQVILIVTPMCMVYRVSRGEASVSPY